MKSMIKNSQSVFIISKIYYKLEAEEDQHKMIDLILKNMQYVNDKSIRQKIQSLLKEAGIILSPEKFLGDTNY
jgi:hypothetical protein